MQGMRKLQQRPSLSHHVSNKCTRIPPWKMRTAWIGLTTRRDQNISLSGWFWVLNKNRLPKLAVHPRKVVVGRLTFLLGKVQFLENTVIFRANDEVREGINFRKTLGSGNDPTSTSPIARGWAQFLCAHITRLDYTEISNLFHVNTWYWYILHANKNDGLPQLRSL